MKRKNKIVIFPPCGENVAIATKRGANKVNLFLPILPRLTAVLPPQGREITARGFTLIELLVVVLIIGILAAVAVPQYKKVIMKQHVAQMKTIAKQFICAENLYRLENGNNTPDIDALAVKVPSDSSFYIYGVTDYKGLSTEYYTIVIRSLKYKDTYALVKFYKASGYAGISWYGDDTVKKIANDL